MSRKDIRFLALNAGFGLCYAAFNVFFFALFGKLGRDAIVVSLLLGVGAFAATAAIRYRAKKGDWLGLPLSRMLPRLMLAVVLATSLTLAVVVTGSALMKLLVSPVTQASVARQSTWLMLGYWMNIAILIGLWTALWAGWSALSRYRLVEISRLRAESERNAMALSVLRARLNPHFVFNALNNVRALINEDPGRARDMVTRLSNTLRHVLEHSERDNTTLAGELEVVEDYLAVESVHYEERLRVRKEIEDDALDAPMPPMVLQLLVENAIKHGISRTPGGGEVVIHAKRNPQGLQIEVTNPGKLSASDQAGFGVGLAWLRAQLKDVPGSDFNISEVAGRVIARLQVNP